jgi:hypothetical protein
MRVRVLVGFLVLGAVSAMSVPAQAATPVQIDMSDAFNEDVIVNGTTLGNLDETQASVDISETSFITQGAAKALANCTEDPDGLQNRGRFAANGDHPLVDLAYDNKKNGKNAHRSPAQDSYRVSVPHRRYRAIHVFATSGNGQSAMRVRLLYGASSSTETFILRDWFNTPGFGGYALVDGRDRAERDASTCHDDDAAAIWGFKVKANKNQRLRAVKIIRPFDPSPELAVLNVFGMTGLAVG